jgi:exonuclease III
VLACIGTLAGCAGGEGDTAGNTELNVLTPIGSTQSGPDAFDIQVVEYTIACNDGIDSGSFLDNGATLDNDVTLSGVLEVLDTAAPGVTIQDFGPDLTEVYVWQAYMDLPPTAGCTVQLRARDGDGEVICTSTETFDISADTTTKVNVLMYCGISFQAPVGMLDLDGDFSFNVANFCPDLFVLNCIDTDIDIQTIPGIGQVAATACQVRFRDGDSSCGGTGIAPGDPDGASSCDPQDCVATPAGLDCAPQPGAVDPIVTTTVTCTGGASAIDCTGTGTPAASCTFTGDTTGNIGDPAPGLLAPGEGGFFVACALFDDDGDPLTPDVPVTPGAVVACTAVTTDGDNDCDKTKTVEVTCPGLTPCQAFGGDAACQASSPTVCQVGTCNNANCDGADSAACCGFVDAPDGLDCSPEILEPIGECQGGVCTPTSCLDDASCDTDDCTFAPPGTCDLGSNLCGPLANEPAGTPCAGNTGQCDGGGACIDNCTGVDCSDGNQCTQDLCDSSGGVATCSNPNEIDGTLCDSGVGPGSGTCQSGTCIGPTAVRVETFNIALAGAFIPFEAERRDPLINAIPTTDADIICLQEVWEQADKDAIVAAAASEFPHSAVFAHDLDTPVDDPTDQNGQIPAMPSGVPCPDANVGDFGANLADQLDQTAQCLADFCSTTGDETGRTTSADCAADACTLTVAGLLFGNELQQRCYACAVTQLPTEVIATLADRCKTIENQDLAFRGQNGVMILSRFPLSNEDTFVVPGTWNRRVVVNATATLPNGAELDVYCNHLTPIFNVTGINTFPYTGQYGGGATTEPEQWEAEQRLQAEKLITYVQQTSGTRPAVVLGDINAGREVTDAGGQIVLYAEGEPTLDVLESVLTLGAAANYEPLCTFCDTNPLNGVEDTLPVWIDHIYLYGLDASTVVSTERNFDEFVVPVQIDDGMGGTTGALVPLSDHYGMRSVIVVP